MEASTWRLGTHRTTCMRWSTTTTPTQAACCDPTSHWTPTRSVMVLVISQAARSRFPSSSDQHMCHNEALLIPGFSRCLILIVIYLGLVEQKNWSLIIADALLGCRNCDYVSAGTGADRLALHVRVCSVNCSVCRSEKVP